MADLKVLNNPVIVGTTGKVAELDALVIAVRDERAAALGEILLQDVEFISTYMSVLHIVPASHTHTLRVLHIASLLAPTPRCTSRTCSSARARLGSVRHCCRRSRCPATPPPSRAAMRRRAHLMTLCMQQVFVQAGMNPAAGDGKALMEALTSLAGGAQPGDRGAALPERLLRGRDGGAVRLRHADGAQRRRQQPAEGHGLRHPVLRHGGRRRRRRVEALGAGYRDRR